MFRPEIVVVDCTIRDGGLINNSRFSIETVKDVYNSLCASGVDIIELGYRNSKKVFSPDKFGLWRFCDDEILKRITDGNESKAKLAVMMDAHKSEMEDIAPKENSPVDIIRVATYVKDIDKAIKLANHATEYGYQTTINIMAVSHTIERELMEALQQIEEETKILACYIVDSFGALYSEDIDFYYHKYKEHLKTKEIGIHCHNHQQLAFANTIQGVIKGINYLDATLYGVGRAAGNCPLELLVSFLKNPKFDLRPILKVIETQILPIKKKIEWGYHIPYMISGTLNLRPEESIKLMSLDKNDPAKNDFLSFYEKSIDNI